jgi:hypothetical protein
MDSKDREKVGSRTTVGLVQKRTSCSWDCTVVEVSRSKDELWPSRTKVLVVDAVAVAVVVDDDSEVVSLVEGW